MGRWSVGQSISQSVGHVVGQVVGHAVGLSVDRSSHDIIYAGEDIIYDIFIGRRGNYIAYILVKYFSAELIFFANKIC